MGSSTIEVGAAGARFTTGERCPSSTARSQATRRAPGHNSGQLSSGGSGYGGAIFASDGSAFLLNVTLASNIVQFGAPSGGEARGGSLAVMDSGLLALTNTLLVCSQGQTNVYGSVLDGGHNLSSDSSAGFNLASSMNNVDPLLSALGGYGGPSPSMRLLPPSPAIDRGDATVWPEIDQRGVRRPQGSAADIGAYELTPALTLTTVPSLMTRVDYVFAANRTNRFGVSTNLTDWSSLGARVSDSDGRTELEEVNPSESPSRFYQVIPGAK